MVSRALAPVFKPLAGVQVAAFGRRGALYMGLGAAGLWAADKALGLGLNVVAGEASNQIKVLRAEKEERESILTRVLGGKAEFFFAPSHNNPYSGLKGVSGPSSIALQSMVDGLRLRASGQSTLADIPPKVLDGHGIFLGGPVANVYARQILGHNGHSPLLSLIHSDLPVKFTNVLSVRPAVGERPRYQVTFGGKTFVSDVNKDFLLLTSLPNVFSRDYGFADHRLFVAAGMHGAGTKALSMLLSNMSLLRKVDQLTKTAGTSWQIPLVVRVNEHSNEPQEVEMPTLALPVKADFKELHRRMEGRPFWISPSDPSLRKT